MNFESISVPSLIIYINSHVRVQWRWTQRQIRWICSKNSKFRHHNGTTCSFFIDIFSLLSYSRVICVLTVVACYEIWSIYKYKQTFESKKKKTFGKKIHIAKLRFQFTSATITVYWAYFKLTNGVLLSPLFLSLSPSSCSNSPSVCMLFQSLGHMLSRSLFQFWLNKTDFSFGADETNKK